MESRNGGHIVNVVLDVDMSSRLYPDALPLAERFRKLVRGGMSPSEAVDRLGELYYAFHFRIVQRLPEGHLLFELDGDNQLVVKLTGRRLDPEKILTREPGIFDPVPIPLKQYRWMCEDPRQAEQDALDALTIDAPQPVPTPDLLAEPAAVEVSTQTDAVQSEATADSGTSTDGRERSEWRAFLVPLLNTLRDANQLPTKTPPIAQSKTA